MWYLKSNDNFAEIVESEIRDGFEVPMSNGERANSISAAYVTKEELIEKGNIVIEPCKCCGNIFYAGFAPEVRKRMLEKHYCFSCDFWDERSKIQHKVNVFIVNNQWYTVDRDFVPGERGFKGHGGAEFRFKKGDEVTISHNTWSGGEIPEIWRKRIPDNAILLPHRSEAVFMGNVDID